MNFQIPEERFLCLSRCFNASCIAELVFPCVVLLHHAGKGAAPLKKINNKNEEFVWKTKAAFHFDYLKIGLNLHRNVKLSSAVD